MGAVTGSVLLLCLTILTPANALPVLEKRVYQVCEDIPPDQDVTGFVIKASDTEDKPLTYSLSGQNARYFTVGRDTGIVKIHLSLANLNLIELDVILSDGFTDIREALRIIVTQANNNNPIFQASSYDFEIPENTTVGTTLFKVFAEDYDIGGTAGVVSYNIDEVSPNNGFDLFTIERTSGEVRLAGNLNYSSLSTFYRLKINATDGGGKCYYNETNYLSSVVYSFISVKDVPDLNPQFLGLPFIASVTENSPVDKSVFEVKAIDGDQGINDVIHYSIEDSTVEGLFKISRTDGVISVMSAIDREVVGDTVRLTVKATESQPNIHGSQASTTANVSINIIDVNDNKPEFYKCGGSGDELSCEKTSYFTGEVVENSLGSIFINMTTKDLDRFSRTNLKLEGADKDVFSVAPEHTTSDSIVQLLVKQPQLLDFEKKQQMVVQVIATDEDEPSFFSNATVTITIKDSNDNNPEFPHDTYKLNVSEHSDVGTIVAHLTAVDPDTMDQGKLTYRLLPESILPYFDVNPLTGSVFVKNKVLLDREVRSLHSATLQAVDTAGNPGSTQLEITVTDINDQPPVINRDSYLVFVEEGGQMEVKIEASDSDEPDTLNSQIVFGIAPSTFSNNFTIDPNTGVLKNRAGLDRESLDPELNGKIQLNVTATDKGSPPLSTAVAVIINVEDINDNTPQFRLSSYNFSVKEGERGAIVGSVHAEDLDQTADFNRISFSINEGSFGSFIIRSFAAESGYSGTISVDPDIELDYENTRKQFMLRVEATDLGQKKAFAMVQVNVLDVNDERPEFRPMSSVTVKENSTITEAVAKFAGQDRDGNHSLVYMLESIKCRCNGSLTPCNWFILDQTGDVRVNQESRVDYEECDQAVMEAYVIDEYTEKGENHSVTPGQIVINIEDINDNAPEFITSDSASVVVSETASKGTSVAGVTANDRDTGVNKQISFKVTAVQFRDGNNKTSNMRMLFEAVTTQQKDFYVGIIQTTEGLDMSLKGKYLVTVTATDTGGLSSSEVLEIFTVDESYKVELQFTQSLQEVEQNLNNIIRALTAATKAAVEVVGIVPETPEESRASVITVMVAYFIYSNGTALTSSEVERMVSSPEHYPVLADLGLRYIGKAPVVDVVDDPVKYIMFGIVGGLIILLAVLITSLMCTRQNYRRKLKAAKAMKSVSMVTSDNQKAAPVVPGTNKYTTEGANPVLNLILDTHLVLDLDEESSDVDKVSLDSLDYNNDVTSVGNDTNPRMMIQEEEEEGHGGPPVYTESLGAALAQRPQKKDKPYIGFNNPAFNSTTNL